jgi:putative transposase
MPRIARLVAAGYPHHITQRGNYKQDTFLERSDYEYYLAWLEKYRRKYMLAILAYCLMPNHVHLVVVPEKQDSLARTLRICHTRYSVYFNKKNSVNGHLWQCRFYSCILDERHLYAAIRYVENNPVRDKLVQNAEDWEWSSARAHLNVGRINNIVSLCDIKQFIEIEDWENYLRSEDETMIRNIRTNTSIGRPLGSDEFISKLEKIMGRQIK